MADLVGKQVGEYRLVRFLGNGTFGDVYEGVQIYLETHVAIKLLKGSFQEEEIEKFRDEARILARLEHPHIVRILTFNVAKFDGQDFPFLAMSLAPNGTLLKRHPRGTPLPLPTIVAYVKQIASALQYAHDSKYIHRDVKPENILLGKNDELLLSDFGVAVIAHSTNSLGRPNVGGTLPYMAPEQLRGRPLAASDQYALGVIAYEWLCGTRPFRGTEAEIIAQHLSTLPPPLKKELCIPPTIEDVIRKALAKNPDKRFPNIQAFATALEQAFLGQTVPKAQEEPIFQAPPNDQRRNSFEQLWAEVMQAQVRGDSKRAFRLLLEILRMKNLTPSQRNLVKEEIRSSPQMISWYIQRARKASTQGDWQAEIQMWEDLLALDSSQQKITEQLTLPPIWSREDAIRERLGIAQQNKQYAWMYTLAQQFISKQDNAAARKQLETLWRQAPFYGDPASLAHIVGLSPADNYEQALAKKLTLEQQQREAAERERQREAAKREQDKKRRAIAEAVSAGTSVGCLAGILLTLLLWAWKTFARGGTPIGHLVSVFVNFPGWWISGIIVGVLVGLIIGVVLGYQVAVLNHSYFGFSRYDIGGLSGGMVGFFMGVVIWGTLGGLIAEADLGAAINIICIVISLCIGPIVCMLAGASIGEAIGEWV
jgi:serine/threonine protein kinase